MEKVIFHIVCLLLWVVVIGIIFGFIGIPIWFYIAGNNENALASAAYIWTPIILLITSDYITELRNKYDKKEDNNSI